MTHIINGDVCHCACLCHQPVAVTRIGSHVRNPRYMPRIVVTAQTVVVRGPAVGPTPSSSTKPTHSASSRTAETRRHAPVYHNER